MDKHVIALVFKTIIYLLSELVVYMGSVFDTIYDIDWHDGVLIETKTEFKNVGVIFTLIASVYLRSGENIRSRNNMVFEFNGVTDLSFVFDSKELISNAIAGNINDVTMKKLGKKQKIYFHFFGGYLAFSFDGLSIIDQGMPNEN